MGWSGEGKAMTRHHENQYKYAMGIICARLLLNMSSY